MRLMAPKPPRDRCNGPDGKEIFATKREAEEALPDFRARHRVGKVQRCAWADHFHLTKGIKGQRGKGRKR